MMSYSFKRKETSCTKGNRLRVHSAKNSIKSPKPRHPISVLSSERLSSNQCYFCSAIALPLLGLRQLFFYTTISQFCCLDAKKWMTHPSHSTYYQPYDGRDCFLYSEKTELIHSKTRDHLRRLPTDQVWAAAAVMAPSAAPSNALAAWH